MYQESTIFSRSDVEVLARQFMPICKCQEMARGGVFSQPNAPDHHADTLVAFDALRLSLLTSLQLLKPTYVELARATEDVVKGSSFASYDDDSYIDKMVTLLHGIIYSGATVQSELFTVDMAA